MSNQSLSQDPQSLVQLVDPLLAWYDKNARVLPWREDPAPYRVWISEIMLQQTRVEAGKPYFERFVAVLPTIEALAGADEQQLLKLWEGLGYYNRVRNLQKAAILVMERYDGILPSDPAHLQKLPGIGAYTAGAIASIAFGVVAPAVDGNVLRVFARLLNDDRDILSPALKKEWEGMIKAIIPPNRAGDFNQALMELGATVCLPNGAPLCLTCPLNGLCVGYACGTAPQLPKKAPKAKRKKQTYTVLLLTCKGKAALHLRPAKGLLAGLWEFPLAEGHLNNNNAEGHVIAMGFAPLSISYLGEAQHIFTHVEWDMIGYCVEVAYPHVTEDIVWASLEEIGSIYPLPSALRAYTGQLPKLLQP